MRTVKQSHWAWKKQVNKKALRKRINKGKHKTEIDIAIEEFLAAGKEIEKV